MLGPDDFAKSGVQHEPIRVTNPMTQEDSLLRTSLLPGMLRALAYNAARRNPSVRLFEIGHIFRQPERNQKLADEREHLAIAIHQPDADATTAAYLARDLAATLRIRTLCLTPANEPGLHPTRTSAISNDVGVIGEIDPEVLSRYGIEGRVAWIEVNVASIVDEIEAVPQMQAVGKFPIAEFDLAVVVHNSVRAEALMMTFNETLSQLLDEVVLFDVYRGAQVASGSRSLAFRFRVAALDRTLGEKEIADARQKAIDAVVSAHGATLRA